jgi:hypothetical protein
VHNKQCIWAGSTGYGSSLAYLVGPTVDIFEKFVQRSVAFEFLVFDLLGRLLVNFIPVHIFPV